MSDESTFVTRRESDGLTNEVFCLSGRHVEVMDLDGTWERDGEKPCDGSCRPVTAQADVAEIFSQEMIQRRPLVADVKVGFAEALARPSHTARVFETWYAKRGGKGTRVCLGDLHLESSWKCDQSVANHYVSGTFKAVPCDGSCHPLCPKGTI